jgi:hypothetical protein
VPEKHAEPPVFPVQLVPSTTIGLFSPKLFIPLLVWLWDKLGSFLGCLLLVKLLVRKLNKVAFTLAVLNFLDGHYQKTEI